MKKPTDKQMLNAARRIHQDEGSIEIDIGPSPKGEILRVSRAQGNPDKGAYVLAWIWVDDESATGEKDE